MEYGILYFVILNKLTKNVHFLFHSRFIMRALPVQFPSSSSNIFENELITYYTFLVDYLR